MKHGDAPTGGVDPFRLLIESVQDYAIFMLDETGRIASWNPGAARIKGYTAAEIIGRHFSVFYPPEDIAAGKPPMELEVATREGRYAEEGWRLRKDGSMFWASVVITAVRDHTGRLVGFAKVTRDLTERRAAEERLRESEARLRLLVESVKDYAIFMLDPDGTIATWNRGAERIKGYRPDEAIGRHFSMFYPPEEIASGHPARELEIARAVGRYEEEGWRVRKNGERFLANVVLTAVHDETGTLRGFAKVTRDLSERRRMEEEARRAEHEAIAERARALEAQHALRQRDEFISVAAHELRTPLAALQLKLQGATIVLQKGAGQATDQAKLTDRIDGAIRQTRRLADLVERVLDLTRIVGGRLVLWPEPTDLTELASQVVADYREPAERVGCELRLRTTGPVRGSWDRARLEQVVTNLLSNAIKYGAGKPIEVDVEATATGARLAVTDHGIGIADDDIDRIFVRFERAVPLQNYGGLGLGLYITRNIVDAHGGSIHVASHPGQGSTFIVELPSEPG